MRGSRLCAVLIAALAATGVGAGSATAEERASRTVLGLAYLGGGAPLRDAAITIETLDGHRLGAAADVVRTNRRGAFVLRGDELPARFVLVARGGYDGGRPFRGSLRAIVRRDAAVPTVDLNPVSTVQVAWLRRHPDAGAGPALARAKRSLSIPWWVDHRVDLQVDGRHLHPVALRRDVAAHGSFDGWVREAVRRIDAGERVSLRGPVASPRPRQALAAASALLGALGQYASSCDDGKGAASQAALGWAVAGMRYYGAGEQNPACAFSNVAVLAQLAAMRQQLTAIQQQLSDLETAIQNGFAELSIELTQVQLEAEIAGLVPALSAIEGLWDGYHHLGQLDADQAHGAYGDWTTAFEAAYAGSQGRVAANLILDAQANQSGVLHTLWTLLRKERQLITPDTVAAYNASAEYYALRMAQWAVMYGEYVHQDPGLNTPGDAPGAPTFAGLQLADELARASRVESRGIDVASGIIGQAGAMPVAIAREQGLIWANPCADGSGKPTALASAAYGEWSAGFATPALVASTMRSCAGMGGTGPWTLPDYATARTLLARAPAGSAPIAWLRGEAPGLVPSAGARADNLWVTCLPRAGTACVTPRLDYSGDVSSEDLSTRAVFERFGVQYPTPGCAAHVLRMDGVPTGAWVTWTVRSWGSYRASMDLPSPAQWRVAAAATGFPACDFHSERWGWSGQPRSGPFCNAWRGKDQPCMRLGPGALTYNAQANGAAPGAFPLVTAALPATEPAIQPDVDPSYFAAQAS